MSETDPFRSTLILIVEIANERRPGTALALPSKCATHGLKKTRDVKLACVTLVDKLWEMAINRRKRSIAFDLSRQGDRACNALVECLPTLGQLVRVEDDALTIAKDADPKQVRWALKYIRKEGGILVMVDPVLPPVMNKDTKLPAGPRLWHGKLPPS